MAMRKAAPLIGLVMGFFLNLIFAVFQAAGQYFSLQIGFGASEVFDPLAQVELPLMGELLNLIALLVFIAASGAGKFLRFGKLFPARKSGVKSHAIAGLPRSGSFR